MPGQTIDLTASDGHRLSAYVARPRDKPLGGLILLQEIFGVTGQLRRCADRYAEQGYAVIMPALFDRVEPDLMIGYEDFQRAGGVAMSIVEADILADIEAARLVVADLGDTGVIGFCFGGTNAYLAASALPISCAISFYGGGISRLIDRMSPQVPVLYHFGGADNYIPVATIDQIQVADPTGVVHLYPAAGHGFCCDDRDSYDPSAAELAEDRSLQFLAQHIG